MLVYQIRRWCNRQASSEGSSYPRDGNRRCTPINADRTDAHPRSSAFIGGFKLSTMLAPLCRTKLDRIVNLVAGKWI